MTRKLLLACLCALAASALNAETPGAALTRLPYRIDKLELEPVPNYAVPQQPYPPANPWLGLPVSPLVQKTAPKKPSKNPKTAAARQALSAARQALGMKDAQKSPAPERLPVLFDGLKTR